MEVTQSHHIHLGQRTMKQNAQQTVYALLLRYQISQPNLSNLYTLYNL